MVPAVAPRFSWDEREVPRRFVGDNVLLSHLAAVLSSVFPEGEAMFVRAVRRYQEQIADPALAARVAVFVRQEATHAREHRRLNALLQSLGYPVRHLDRRAGWGIRAIERVLPPIVMLSATAALEHATAVLADVVLDDANVQALFLDDQVRELVCWHAEEESDHRAVAFDVYREVGGPEWLRAWTLRVAVVTTGLDLGSALVTSVALDPEARSLRVLRRSWQDVRRSPFAGTHIGARFWAYTDPDFHPSLPGG